MISLRCTEHPPMYSWYPPMYSWYPSNVLNIPDVLMVSPHIHHDIPLMYWTSSNVLMISPDVLMISPQCTHDIPFMYWTPPDVLNIPRCTEHLPMYWTHIIQGEVPSELYSMERRNTCLTIRKRSIQRWRNFQAKWHRKISLTGLSEKRIYQPKAALCRQGVGWDGKPLTQVKNFQYSWLFWHVIQIINSLLRSSRERNTVKHINTILSSIKTHSSVFSGTYLISSTFIDFRILNNYNDAIINFIFFPIIFWLNIITEICLQIRTKNMQIMECLKNYQLRKNLDNNIFFITAFCLIVYSLSRAKSYGSRWHWHLTLFHMGKGVGGADITPLSSNIV